MTRLAASILARDPDAALAEAGDARGAGAELVEFRIDAMDAASHHQLAELVAASPLPCIVTDRPVWEGGHNEASDADRVARLLAACSGARPPAYVDYELAAWRRDPAARATLRAGLERHGVRLILSSHDFEHRPADLTQRLEAIVTEPACHVLKLAWRARSLRDNIEAFEILRTRHKPAIVLTMGEPGLPSRVLAKKFNALLSFAAVRRGEGTAIGQPRIDELRDGYRWAAIGAETQVYGVIGDPVGHSMSPAIHNAGFDATGHDGVYLPMPIPGAGGGYESFKATVGAWLDFAPLHFRGASVTIPHKENLLRFVAERGGEIEPLAATIGAANTLTVRADGSLLASNTDYDAALDAVAQALGRPRDAMASLRVAVIGAGGAARAIVAGFAEAGATVVVYNRTVARGEALAEELGPKCRGKIVAAPIDRLCRSCCHVLVNCTPVGMAPHVDASPIDPAEMRSPGDGDGDAPGWGPGLVVFDTIYNPMRTRLLHDAARAGCMTVSGAEMFVRQAAKQFEAWTGGAAPIDVFRRVITERLGGETDPG